jgi:hypothetical protein
MLSLNLSTSPFLSFLLSRAQVKEVEHLVRRYVALRYNSYYR